MTLQQLLLSGEWSFPLPCAHEALEWVATEYDGMRRLYCVACGSLLWEESMGGG